MSAISYGTHTTLDRRVDEAYRLLPRGAGGPLSINFYLSIVRSAALILVRQCWDPEWPFGVSGYHYESVCQRKYSYRHLSLMVLRHNVVSSRLRLGYRPLWFAAGMGGEPPFKECLAS